MFSSLTSAFLSPVERFNPPVVDFLVILFLGLSGEFPIYSSGISPPSVCVRWVSAPIKFLEVSAYELEADKIWISGAWASRCLDVSREPSVNFTSSNDKLLELRSLNSCGVTRLALTAETDWSKSSIFYWSDRIKTLYLCLNPGVDETDSLRIGSGLISGIADILFFKLLPLMLSSS